MLNKFSNYNISEELVRALDGLGYKEPSEVQKKVIPEILMESDIVVKSQTGSGKTAAFGIPVCEKIFWDEGKPQVLVLTPTRELAMQVKEEIKNIGRFKRIKAVAVFGKFPFSDQARELKQRTHIVVGTPGRVMDHISRKTLDTSNIKYLIIDEADEMLNMGFIEQVKEILEVINNKRQTILLSATMPEEIINLSSRYMVKPKTIEIQSQNIIADKINHSILMVTEQNKSDVLQKLLIKETPNSAVIFCKTKENVDRVFEELNSVGYSVDKIHGGLLQKDRLDAMNRFKRGDFRLLVATDVAARGIDVEGISHVINYDLPVEKEAYVHRLGRTARAGAKGKAVSFVNQYENTLLKSIEDYLEIKIPIDLEILDEDILEDKDKAIKILKSSPKRKTEKSKEINKNITKIYLNGGKKKKIRAGDIVGAISRIENIESNDIGIIDIQDTVSYVEILNGKGNIVIKGLKEATIKGKKLKIEKAKK